MRFRFLILFIPMFVSLQGQIKNRYLEFGVSPGVSNGFALNIQAPKNFTGNKSNYIDSISNNRKTTTPFHFFVRYLMEQQSGNKFGIGVEYASYGHSRIVDNPKLGFEKHEDLGVLASSIGSSMYFKYTTGFRSIEVPIIVEFDNSGRKLSVRKSFNLSLAPSFVWSNKLRIRSYGYSEEGKNNWDVTSYRSKAPVINGVLAIGYKWVFSINQPVQVMVQPQIKLPIVPSSGDESYLYFYSGVNVGIYFGGKMSKR